MTQQFPIHEYSVNSDLERKMVHNMKDYYKINEIARLYGIGPDSLRYYEKLGLLSPRRDTNGYRLYNLKDMYKLTVIRDLRKLDFSMAQIREFLEGQCIDNTLAQLRREQSILEEKLQEMKRRKSLIEKRIEGLEAAEKIETGTITLLEMPERRCVLLEQYITKDEEMDLVIKKLHRQHEDRIQDLGTQTIGAFFSEDVIREGIPNSYDSVFFVLEDGTGESDFVLPAGRYASCFYRGGYEQNAEQVHRMLDYLEEAGVRASGGAFELYRIDNRDTIGEEEFLTEIQIPVKVGEGKNGE